MESVAEEWRELTGELKGYFASSRGRIASTKRGDWRVLYTAPNSRGYESVCLARYSGGQISARVHRLVATAFCDGYRPGLEVNHINGDKLDNRAENLEWVTTRQNHEHAVSLGLRERIGVGHFRRKMTLSDADVCRKLMDRGVTQKFLARWFGVTPSAISCIRRGITYQN